MAAVSSAAARCELRTVGAKNTARHLRAGRWNGVWTPYPGSWLLRPVLTQNMLTRLAPLQSRRSQRRLAAICRRR